MCTLVLIRKVHVEAEYVEEEGIEADIAYMRLKMSIYKEEMSNQKFVTEENYLIN